MSRAVSARVVERGRYPTHLRPEEYAVDWPAYYDRFDERTADLQRSAHHERNVVYGDDPYQILDLYYPDPSATSCPVLLFLHGGKLREGHPYHYGFLARPYIERGVIFISAGYRLHPEFTFQDAAGDIVKLLAWTYRNVGQRGGNRGRLHVSGHSAGALLAADLAFRGDWQAEAGLPLDVVRSAILISGRYERTGTPPDGSVPPELAVRVDRVPLATIVSFGQAERNRRNEPPSAYAESGSRVAELVRGAGGDVHVVPLDGLDHPDTAVALADECSPLFRSVDRLLRPGAAVD